VNADQPDMMDVKGELTWALEVAEESAQEESPSPFDKVVVLLATALREREQQLREAREAYDELYDWVSSMPEAGFSNTSPRWSWWHKQAAARRSR
jgi:hypothetical protein